VKMFAEGTYEGLGRMLLAAGVKEDRIEELVVRVIKADAVETRAALRRDVHILVGDELDRIGELTRNSTLDINRTLSLVQADLAAYRGCLTHARSRPRRMVAAIVLAQAIMSLAVLASVLLWAERHNRGDRCGTGSPASGPWVQSGFGKRTPDHEH